MLILIPKETIYFKVNSTIGQKESNIIFFNKNFMNSIKKDSLFTHYNPKINIFVNKISKKSLYSFYILIFLCLTCFNSFVKCTKRRIISGFSYIMVKINVTGYVQIISEGFTPFPDEVNINGNIMNDKKYAYYFNNSANFIKLTWNDELESTSSMFSGCSNITEINFTNFDSSQVIDMSNMFGCCSSLSYIDFTNFDTSQVIDMSKMFYCCSSLSSLDLSYFDGSQIDDMDKMFFGCSSLISLDISTFIAFQAHYKSQMFYGCSQLVYLNIGNTVLEQNLLDDLISSELLICSVNYIYEDIFIEKLYVNCNNNIVSYNNDELNICYTNNITNINKKQICSICGNDFFLINNSLINSSNNSYFTCHYSPKGNYLDKSNLVDNLCYFSCKTCDILGNETNHNCIECKDDYIYEYNLFKYKNCYINYSYNELSNILNNTMSNTIINTINNTICNTYELTTDFNIIIENKSELIKSIIDNIFNELNITDIDNGIDKKIIEKDLIIIFTSTLNQKKNEDEYNITMNLGPCESRLKNYYNISSNNSLYILQIISEETGMKIPKIEYEVYYPLNNAINLTKLNLSSCKDTKIEISLAVQINDSLDKYNSNSEYYNNICSKTTSESGTDISLKDRRNEFIENNMTLCQENCDLIGYNYEKAKAKCSCDIKLNISENYNIKFNKKDFYKNFIDINSIANINIIKCFKIVLKIKSLMKNYGFFIMLIIFIIYIITFFIFWFLSYKLLKKDINNIIFSLNYNETIKIEQVNKNKIKKNKGKKKRKQRKKNNENNENLDLGTKNDNNNNREYIRTELENKKELIKDDYSGQITQNIENNSNKRINKIDIKAFGLVDVNNINDKNLKELLEQKDFELNSLDYKEAWEFDKRTYFKYYISLLRNNHPIMFSFAPYKDYNSKIIKIFLFFFSFGTDFTINALFFNDETMHKIYEDKGKFNFLFQIPQIIYSSLISKFIDLFIRKLALSQDNIVKLKQENEKMKIGKKSIRTIKVLKKKFISFFVIVFFILLFFWYYIICFCGIYINTQMHLIKDSAFSLLTGLLYPLAMCLIPGIFRISALRVDKPNRGFLYKFSSFLEDYLC